MNRPTLICHMITSLDGRLLPQRWPGTTEALIQRYESTAERLAAHGWIVGRRTMAEFLPTGEPALADTPRGRTDRIAAPRAGGLAIGFDRQGRLRPERADIDGDHLVLVLGERVADAHVADLAARGVSVVFAGPQGDDIAGALARIGAAFGVTRLLLEGGGRLNGAFLAAGLIDETSTLIHPVVDGQADIPAIYDHRETTAARPLKLIGCETFDDGTVWLRHRVSKGN